MNHINTSSINQNSTLHDQLISNHNQRVLDLVQSMRSEYAERGLSDHDADDGQYDMEQMRKDIKHHREAWASFQNSLTTRVSDTEHRENLNFIYRTIWPDCDPAVKRSEILGMSTLV